MTTKVDRLTGLGIRDSFLPRLQALHAELEAARVGLNYLLYEVDPQVDRNEEDRLSTLGYVSTSVEDMVGVLGRMK